MGNRKENVFIVLTEYHILISLSIILEKFSDQEKYINTIIMLISQNRLKADYKFEWPGSNVEILTINMSKDFSFFSSEIKKTIVKILDRDIYNLFYFLENEFVTTYVINKLKKKGTNVCLCQDGLKAYATKRHAPLYSRIKSTFLMHLRLWRNCMPVDNFYLYDSGFGKYKHDDQYWLTNPELYSENKFSKPIEKISTEILSTKSKIVETVFNFTNADAENLKGKFFYVNQPLPNEVVDFECKIIFESLLKHGAISIKLHPHTSAYAIEQYSSMPGVFLFKSGIPAEIYIQHMRNIIILSGWSTALLIDNPTCSYYWLFPLMKKNVKMIDINIQTVPSHIQIIDDLLLIESRAKKIIDHNY
jgi:hypothetical protein